MSSQRVPLLKPKSVRKPTRVAIGPRPISSQSLASKATTSSVVPRQRANSTSVDQTQEKTQVDAQRTTAEKEQHDESSDVLDPIAILSAPKPTPSLVVKPTAKNSIAPGGSFGATSTPRLASISKPTIPAIHIPPVAQTSIEKSPKITPTSQRKTPPAKLFMPSAKSKSPTSKSPVLSAKEPTTTPPAKSLTPSAGETIQVSTPSAPADKNTPKNKPAKSSTPAANEADSTPLATSKATAGKTSTKAKAPRSADSNDPKAKRAKRSTRSTPKITIEEDASSTEKDAQKPKKVTRLSTLRKKTKERVIVSAKDRVLKYARKALASDYDKQKPASKPRKKPVEDAVSESEDEIASAALVARQTMGELALSIPVGRRVESDVEEEEEEETPVRRKQRKVASGAPQVEFIDGQIVISQSSLTMHDDELAVTQDSDGENERSNRRYGSGYLAGRRQTKRWTHPETKQFFYHLSQIGPDFTLMSTLFPHRSRYELKQKFKKEERAHRSLVDLALSAANRPIASDIMELAGEILENEKQKKLKEKLDEEEEDDEKDDNASDELIDLY